MCARVLLPLHEEMTNTHDAHAHAYAGHTDAADARKKKVVADALVHASWTSLCALATATAGVAAGSRFLPAFRRSLSVSSATALCISPAFFTFFLSTELFLARDARQALADRQKMQRLMHTKLEEDAE